MFKKFPVFHFFATPDITALTAVRKRWQGEGLDCALPSWTGVKGFKRIMSLEDGQTPVEGLERSIP